MTKKKRVVFVKLTNIKIKIHTHPLSIIRLMVFHKVGGL